MIRWIVAVAGVLGLAAVALGAYGAHGLEKGLLEQGLETSEVVKRIAQCETGVRYHMFHVLALLIVGLAAERSSPILRTLVSVFFLLGITLFSGGLYALVFLKDSGPAWATHWAIVPCGGLCFMLGWLSLTGIAFVQTKAPQ